MNDVAITKCILKKENNAVIEGLDLIDAKNKINNDDVVVIVPNFVNHKKPDPQNGVTVGDETLRTIIKWVKECHPKRIVVASGSGGGNTMEVVKHVGYDKVIREEQVEFIDLNTGPYVDLELNHNNPSKIKINEIYMEMTKVVSFTQLKVHEEATMSASIKNVALSFPSSEEHGTPKKNKGIHENLHGFIRAMLERINIDIAIVSLNPVMVATGPTKGIAKHTGLVIVGNDAVCVDTICARILGYKPQAIRYLYELEQKGYNTDINKINIKGIELKEAERIFTNKVYGEESMID